MIVLFCIVILYAFCLLYFSIGFIKCQYFKQNSKHVETKLSIIICARNEEANIEKCLKGIAQQNYPKHLMEIIFTDDASRDQTLLIAQDCLLNSGIEHQIIQNKLQLGKKKSLDAAIALAKNELLITRDADTFTDSNLWLQSLVDFQNQTQSDMVIAPLAMNSGKGFLWSLQALENNVLQVLSAGSNYFGQSFLCSGANMAFTKKIYLTCNGYKSHMHVASGDDVLFLEDVKKIPSSRITFLKSKDAIVNTYVINNISELISQKVRWASKFKYNSNKLNFALGFLSFLANAIWLICITKMFMQGALSQALIGILLIKLCVDFLILFVASNFIKNKSLMVYAIPALCIYPIYACTIALASLLLKPHWKK